MAALMRALMPKGSPDSDDGKEADGGSGELSRRSSFFSALSERIDVEMQISGNIWKRDTAGSSSWTLRYFVVKDGFLLYYPESKSTMMHFDFHPKGVIPLDGVEIETVRKGPNKTMQSGFRISHPSFGSKSLLLCAKDDTERERWVEVLRSSVEVTYSRLTKFNADSDAMKRTVHESQLKAANAATALAGKQEELNAKQEEVNAALARIKQLEAALTKAELKIGTLTNQAAALADFAGLTNITLPTSPSTSYTGPTRTTQVVPTNTNLPPPPPALTVAPVVPAPTSLPPPPLTSMDKLVAALPPPSIVGKPAAPAFLPPPPAR